MTPDRHNESPSDDGFSRRDHRALSILEGSAARSGPGLLWARVRFQLAVVWGARLAIAFGLVVCIIALAAMWVTMSTHLAVAVGCELVLTAGALLFAHGIRLWWSWRQAKQPLSE